MKMIFKIAGVTTVLLIMLIADIPLLVEQYAPPLFEQIVPEAHAIMGVRRRTRRRTAVVVGSAASAQTAAAQQQAAAAQQEEAAATPPPQPATRTPQAVAVGTVTQSLPGACTPVVVNGVSYSDCNGVFYRAAFQANNLVYVVVEKPLK